MESIKGYFDILQIVSHIKIIAFDLMEVILWRDEHKDYMYQDFNRYFDLDDAGFYPWVKEKYELSRTQAEERILEYMREYYRVVDKTVFDLVKQYPFALATNHLSVVIDFIDEIGIKKHFSWITNSSEILVRKPDSKFFTILLDKVQENPKDILYIDDYVGNIEAAKNMGFQVLHFNEDHKQTNLKESILTKLSDL